MRKRLVRWVVGQSPRPFEFVAVVLLSVAGSMAASFIIGDATLAEGVLAVFIAAAGWFGLVVGGQITESWHRAREADRDASTNTLRKIAENDAGDLIDYRRWHVIGPAALLTSSLAIGIICATIIRVVAPTPIIQSLEDRGARADQQLGDAGRSTDRGSSSLRNPYVKRVRRQR